MKEQAAEAVSWESLIQAGRVALAAGDYDAVMAPAERVIQGLPNDRQGYILKAQALLALGRLGDALDTVTRGLQRLDRDAKLLSFARTVALRQGGIEAAAPYALQIAEIAPGELKNELFLIDLELARGDVANAARRAEDLVSAFPDSPQALMSKARAQLAQGDATNALATLRHGAPAHGENQKFLSLGRNIAAENGLIDEAVDYALKIAAVAPENRKNQSFLIQSSLAKGDFAAALTRAELHADADPNDPYALLLKVQALIALHREKEALEILSDAVASHEGNLRILNLARTIATQHGRFEQALDYSRKLAQFDPRERSKAFLVHACMTRGKIDEARDYLQSLGPVTEATPLLLKEAHYLEKYERLKSEHPAFTAAWDAALGNPVDSDTPPAPSQGHLGTTMIQYWSQGAPPRDVQIVCDDWKRLLERDEIGEVRLFDRSSAQAWIDDNAPEFSSTFSKSFHYAMESDIFRIAYASRQPCIYMDIDSWPLEHSGRILRSAVQSGRSMLYLRAHRPWIANGFFVAAADCLFFKELIRQCLEIDLDSLPKDYLVIEGTFGPSRYNNVLYDLLKSSAGAVALKADGMPGCSKLSIDGQLLYFSHEAAVANVKPPFPLGYKGTGDYWKYVTVAE